MNRVAIAAVVAAAGGFAARADAQVISNGGTYTTPGVVVSPGPVTPGVVVSSPPVIPSLVYVAPGTYGPFTTLPPGVVYGYRHTPVYNPYHAGGYPMVTPGSTPYTLFPGGGAYGGVLGGFSPIPNQAHQRAAGLTNTGTPFSAATVVSPGPVDALGVTYPSGPSYPPGAVYTPGRRFGRR